ncbi:DUF6333 family protein [Streptomyces sp. NPDC056652]|uniref:DUF6333 family protein n=1 Tax=Streptomyces sp. NPDC056652 TaxID=3345893 RepID=UPI0036A55642
MRPSARTASSPPTDPARLLRAVGVDPDGLGGAYLHTERGEPFIGVDYLDLLARGLHSFYGDENLMVSVFKVARTDDVQDAIDDVWRED